MLIENAQVNRSELADKVAVVTGAGQGIGKQTARILAHLGARVVIAEIGDSGLGVERRIRAQGGEALFIRTDVADSASVEHLRQHACATFGKVDILVNAAAAHLEAAFSALRGEEPDRLFAVNVRGALLPIRAFLPAMLERNTGVVVSVVWPGDAARSDLYLASQAARKALVLSLAAEIRADRDVSAYSFDAGMVRPAETRKDRPATASIGAAAGIQSRVQNEPEGRAVSVELAATGLVGTILHSRNYHGQETSYQAGLAKLGLDRPGRNAPASDLSRVDDYTELARREDAAATGHLERLGDCSGDLPARRMAGPAVRRMLHLFCLA